LSVRRISDAVALKIVRVFDRFAVRANEVSSVDAHHLHEPLLELILLLDIPICEDMTDRERIAEPTADKNRSMAG
jgi:hypothetical protein